MSEHDSIRTGLQQLDSTLSLMDRQVNILGMEGSRMDWEDLMEWQRVILGGGPAPTAEEPPPAKPSPFRVAGLPDPQHGGAKIWGSDGSVDDASPSPAQASGMALWSGIK